MTEKQERIVKSALELFAKSGYEATSTSKVAKAAGVSEGLIFRHFTNKEGLLNAILELGKQKINANFLKILTIEEPYSILHGVICFPFDIKEEEYYYWKLLYAHKWQSDVYDSSMTAPIRNTLIGVFGSLKYVDPETEADLLISILDGIATSILLNRPANMEKVKLALLAKYWL